MSEHNQKKFYPDYLFEILAVTLVSVEVVIALSYLFAPVTGRPIDFSRNFLPLPEWYFLYLYQLLKYFPGKWAFFGVMVIPLIGLYLIYALPFLEKTRSRRLRDRKVSAVIGGAMLLGAVILTILSVAG
jgi:quinol-cytochrome oxidoreductase complex cytochrome b subunit